MRLLRALAMAAVFAALLSRSGAAQDARQFKDAWFWGIKGGALSFSSTTTTNGGAPLVGGEWLITRTGGGLYISYDQAFFTTQGGFVDHDPDSTFTRPVRLKDLRRFTIAGMVFPIQSRVLHPYAGLGLLFSQIGGTQLLSPVSNPVRYVVQPLPRVRGTLQHGQRDRPGPLRATRLERSRRPRHEGIAGHEVALRPVGSLGNADAWRHANIAIHYRCSRTDHERPFLQ